MGSKRVLLTLALTAGLAVGLTAAPPPQAKPKAAPAKVDPRLEKLKQEAVADVEAMKDLTQQMVDSIYSFGEPGYEEFEARRYVSDILTKNGFTVEKGGAGMPSFWLAKWGSGKPVIGR